MDRSVKQDGFTLVGTLVSLLVATLGLLGLLQMSTLLGDSQQEALTVHRANTLAKNIYERSLASDSYHTRLPSREQEAEREGMLDYWAGKDASGNVAQVWVKWRSAMHGDSQNRLCFAFDSTMATPCESAP